MQKALQIVQDEKSPEALRIRFVGLFGQTGDAPAAATLLKLAGDSHSTPVRKAALESLGRFDDPDLGKKLVALSTALPADLHPAAIATLLGRPAWAAELLRAIDSGALPRTDLGTTQIQRIRQYDDPAVVALGDKLFGKVVKATSQEREQEVERVTRLVTTGAGDALAGRELFTQRCAVCHTLFGHGGKLGPDLTGYERRNVDFLVVSVVDPSAYIREEYTAFRIRTRDGETLIGIITERAANQITIVDSSQQKTVIPKAQILDERAMSTSLMPEGLLGGLSDQQVRDLFKYLSSEKPVGE
jgi:putative heme-binding domain-containing protein